MTSKNICKTHSFKNQNKNIDWERYVALCDCGSNDHQHELVLEYDSKLNIVSLSLYFKTWTEQIYDFKPGFKGYLQNIWKNIVFRLKCLIKGYNTMYYEFVFSNEEAIQDYINALQQTLNEMRNNKQQTERKNE